MQQLLVELKNTPRDASLVPCSVSSGLNREETLSDQNVKLANNNPEENHSQRTGRSIKPFVYVLSKQGKPLMPCSQAKSKRMFKGGKAHVVKRMPFTIQLNFECEEKTQPVICGIDPGYSNIGFSCRTETKELISGEVKLDNHTKSRLNDRRMYRRNRRNRLWYREPRFNNRVSTKKNGWLSPSVHRRLDTHINLVKKLTQILPITKAVIEVANFDIQKINNPDIEGVQYQQGSLYGYENVKAYLIHREHGKCQLCGKEYKNGWHVHHIIPRSEGGTDKPNNLALLHKPCHKKLHKQKLFSSLKKAKQFKSETFMSIIRWRLVEELKGIITDIDITYGHLTKINRMEHGIDKTHNNDAFIISGGSNQKRCLANTVVQKRKNNRCLQKNRNGFKPSIRRKRYAIQPKDIVKIGGKWVETNGIHDKGDRLLVGKKSINIKIVGEVFNVASLIWN